MIAPLPPNEAERLAALHRYRLLDTPPEEDFDNLVRLAAHICNVPIAAISLIDAQRQWFKSILGVNATEVPREVALCAHTILQPDLLIVQDTQDDPRFQDNPQVTGEPHVRFYAGAPLMTEDGFALGTLCVADMMPRHLTRSQEEGLRLLVSLAASQLKAAQRVAERECLVAEQERLVAERERADAVLSQTHAALAESEERLRRLTDAAFEGIAVSQDGILIDVSPAFADLFGYDQPAEMAGIAPFLLADPNERGLVAHKVACCDEDPYEATLQRRDGTSFQAELRGRKIQIGGRSARVTAVRDITARKAMEEALRISHNTLQQSEARLAEAQEVAQIGNWEFETATGKITWSQKMFSLFGFQPAKGEPSYKDFLARYHPDDLLMHESIIQQAISNGLPFAFDIRIFLPDGSQHWLHTIGRGEHDSSGHVLRLFGTSMDITERKQSEERFRVLFEWSSHAHLLFDEGGIIDCNDAAVALLRCQDKRQVLSLHPAVLSPEFQPDGRRSLEKCLEMDALAQEHGFHCFEWMHRKADGEEFPVEVTLTPVTLAERPVLLVVWHDLTERHRVEESKRQQEQALRESEERYRLLVEGARDYAMILTDVEGRVTSWNAGAELITGWSEAEVLGQSADLLFTPEDHKAEVPECEWIQAAAQGQAMDLRWYMKKDGTRFYADGILEALRDEAGRPRGFAKVFRDVTGRRALEAERERLANANRLLLDSTGDGIYGIDTEGRFTFVNRAAAQALGFMQEQMIGRNGHALIHRLRPDGAFYPEGECPIYRAIHASESTYVEDDVFWRADGTSFPVAYNAAPIFENGIVGGAVVTFADISERKALDAERERLVQREHRIAEQLQAALQPEIPSLIPGMEIAGFYRPALSEAGVGGDFSDVFSTAEGVTFLVLGDLSGKGLAAACQVATVRHMLRFALLNGHTVAEPLTTLNRTLAVHDLLQGFATLFVGRYDHQTHAFTYVNCGQDSGQVLRAATGNVEALPPTGPVLGMSAEAEYKERSIFLEVGDALALFTDGLSEAGPTRMALLTGEGVAGLLKQQKGITKPQIIVEGVISGVEAHARAGVRDDQCLLVGVVTAV